MKKVRIGTDKKVWFTSDLHFDHRNVITFSGRPYEHLSDMNIDLKQRWNSVVSDEDVVFVLGDFCWSKDRHRVKKLIDDLKGETIYIIYGNHDPEGIFDLCDERVVVLGDLAQVFIADAPGYPIYELFISHEPMMTWPHRGMGAYQLFGHIHSGPTTRAQMDQDLPLWDRQYDVGCDNNNYTPICLEDIINKFDNEFKVF